MSTTTTTPDLDIIFEALAHKHRREIVAALSRHPHAISQLAAQRNLSLPAIYKHIKILEAAGLVSNKKISRTHFLTLNKKALRVLQAWLMQYHAYWGTDNESLDNYAAYITQEETVVKGGGKK